MISLLFWLVVIPFCIGLLPAHFITDKKAAGPGLVLLSGFFVMWALFEAAALPAVIFVRYANFRAASVGFAAGSILCAMAGVLLAIRRRRAPVRADGGIFAPVRAMSWAERSEWLLFFGLLGFQLYKAAAYASFDGDDAYYVVESLIAQQADVMYRILPYTGRPTDLDVRHALAVFPMWIAYIADRSGIHATIVSHLIMPLVLIPLSYLVYYEIGRLLFCRRADENGGSFSGEDLPIFMIIMALFQMFGNVSIYTNETFFLTRTWQGKAVAGSLVIPALFWIFLQIYGGREREGRTGAGVWIVFVCVNMTAGICSSIAVFLISILTAVAALALAVVQRDLKVLLKMGAACIPNVVYMAIYVVMAYSYLW